MKKIPLIVVEDEAPARAKLVHYVQQDPRFELVGEAQNGRQALMLLEEKQPAVMLLDIQMPGLSGFDILRLMEKRNVAVIFTTAYEQYAVQAFEVSALDYVLKPVNQTRLQQALDKAVAYHGKDQSQHITTLLGQVSAASQADEALMTKRLAVRRGKTVQLLPVEEISFIRSEHRLVNIYDSNFQSYWTNELLSDLEKRLPNSQFMRIHRGAIVNLHHPFTIESWNSGRLRLHFSSAEADTNEILIVSREYTKKFKQRM